MFPPCRSSFPPAQNLHSAIAKLEITPAPDTLLRVFMAFYPSEEAVDIPAQEITPCQRQGFTVVEWGGSQVDGQE